MPVVIAVRILNGERVESIPVDTVCPVPVFDDNQLKRWRVDRAELPAGCLILNEHVSFWRVYANYIIIVGSALSCIVVGNIFDFVAFEIQEDAP